MIYCQDYYTFNYRGKDPLGGHKSIMNWSHGLHKDGIYKYNFESTLCCNTILESKYVRNHASEGKHLYGITEHKKVSI